LSGGEHAWAIEGCQGIGKHVAIRLLADDETVVDVPPKMSARALPAEFFDGRTATEQSPVELGKEFRGLRRTPDACSAVHTEDPADGRLLHADSPDLKPHHSTGRSSRGDSDS
jgi:hypothetical protein